MNHLKTDIKITLSDISFIFVITLCSCLLLLGVLYYANYELWTYAQEYSQFIGYLLASIVFLVGFWCIKKLHIIHFSELKPKNLLWGLAGFGVLIILNIVINYFFKISESTTIPEFYQDYIKGNNFLPACLAILAAVFFEEIFFRGVLQKYFVDKFSLLVGVLITAMIFALLHTNLITYEGVFLYIFLMGLVLSYTRELTLSVVPCIFAHFFNNFMVYFVF